MNCSSVIRCHHQVSVLINDTQLEYLTSCPSVTILDKEGKKVKSFGDVEFYHPHGVADKITMDGKNVVFVRKEGTGFAIVTESLFLLLLDTFILLIRIIII